MHAASTDSVAFPEVASPTADARLRDYAALLARWTRRINLISQADEAQIWPRHIEDCLRLLPLIPPGTERAIDLGSGAGLPGLVLAIASAIPFDLIEADRRKAAFLNQAKRITDAPVTVQAVRIEQAMLPPAPLVTARALAPLQTLLHLAAPLLSPGGLAIFPKGQRADEEIAAAARSWRFDLERAGTPQSPILMIRSIAHG